MTQPGQQVAGQSRLMINAIAQQGSLSRSSMPDPQTELVNSSQAVAVQVSQDFGHLVQGCSQTVIQPKDGMELAALLQTANRDGIPITVRGRGRSQSGQAVSVKGVVLETSGLKSIQVNLARTPSTGVQASRTVTCGSGATWREVLAICQLTGYLPYVMPLNLDLTVGGTLSAGGFSANSHRYGTAIAHVQHLEVVTGAGERMTCSAESRPEVFHAVLGGLGRCGIIASATLALRPFKTQVRTYYLRYEEMEPWLADQQRLAKISSHESSKVDYLEGFCASSIQGLRKTDQGRRPFVHWQYGLQVGVEFDPSRPPQDAEILEGLHYRQLLLTEEDETVAYAARYDARFRAMRQSGAWELAHPWFEALLPLAKAQEFITQALELLPFYFGDGHRVLMLAETEAPELFMRPQSPAVIFAVLPTGIPADQVPEALKVLAELDKRLVQVGGKRYLSGWLGAMTPQSWQTHFGAQYPHWLELKKNLDPNQVLRSALFP